MFLQVSTHVRLISGLNDMDLGPRFPVLLPHFSSVDAVGQTSCSSLINIIM